MPPRFLIAADTGGTFTDLAVFDMESRSTMVGKILTDYGDLVRGVIDGLADTGATVADAANIKHGTTHVINSLIQRRGARAALVTTAGFQDVLEIARANRAVQFDLGYKRPPPLVPRSMRFEVGERMGSKGEVVEPLDEAALIALCARLRELAVESVAVAFVNSYVNPSHELRARDILRSELGDVFVTTSAELSREWGEFERTSTAVANAFVGAGMARYVAGFESSLRERRFPGRVFMMGSNGGVMSTSQACAEPIAMIESGPVGGCMGAAAYAQALGIKRMVAFDMGGTTAKCALVEDGRFDVQSTYYVGGYDYGFPVRTPVLDIVEVGAGGGSIAWVDENGRLKVGPRSAGSSPGPVAFNRGGTEPTVTDANIVLGRIGSDSFMGGRLQLDLEGARHAIASKLADRLGMNESPANLDELAQGILDIATVTMTGAIKEISTERGRDVRGFVLFAFGGGGPIFGAELAESLGIETVLIPPNPGAFSSFGMLLADARRDFSRTYHSPVNAQAVARLGKLLAQMEQQLVESMAVEFDTAHVTFEHEAEMRYLGQSHTVRVRLDGSVNESDVLAAFEQTYRKRFGHVNSNFVVEFLILHVAAIVPTAAPTLTQMAPLATEQPEPVEQRNVYFRSVRGRIRTPVYRRLDLPIGFELVGPAVIEEYSSTVIVGTGQTASIGKLGEIRIQVGHRSEETTHAR